MCHSLASSLKVCPLHEPRNAQFQDVATIAKSSQLSVTYKLIIVLRVPVMTLRLMIHVRVELQMSRHYFAEMQTLAL